jgi:hypothetical protein
VNKLERARAASRAYQRRNRERLSAKHKNRLANEPGYAEKIAETQRKYRLSSKGKRRRVAKYGLTREGYEAMYATQEGRCLGCRRSFASLGREPDIDHNHRTGQVRGLLCHSCNLILGLARDEVSTLFDLIKHLESARGVFD